MTSRTHKFGAICLLFVVAHQEFFVLCIFGNCSTDSSFIVYSQTFGSFALSTTFLNFGQRISDNLCSNYPVTANTTNNHYRPLTIASTVPWLTNLEPFALKLWDTWKKWKLLENVPRKYLLSPWKDKNYLMSFRSCYISNCIQENGEQNKRTLYSNFILTLIKI